MEERPLNPRVVVQLVRQHFRGPPSPQLPVEPMVGNLDVFILSATWERTAGSHAPQVLVSLRHARVIRCVHQIPLEIITDRVGFDQLLH